MKKSLKKYQKPRIKSKKVKINFASNKRFFDSFDELLAPNAFAQSCGGSGSGSYIPMP